MPRRCSNMTLAVQYWRVSSGMCPNCLRGANETGEQDPSQTRTLLEVAASPPGAGRCRRRPANVRLHGSVPGDLLAPGAKDRDSARLAGSTWPTATWSCSK